ncbi:MAG TPA: carboxypeptidase-like regulatory domain-containing protein [Longimicrobium sp.]|nr:carboxypeptidase-like regulatory domain-containing protein [Longimicrobium sp.]
MKTPFRAIAGALAVLAAQPLAAQTVRGRVLEHGTGRGVSFATVTVLDASGQAAGYAQSGAMGEYEVRVRGAGRYFIRAEHVGYIPASTGLTRVREGRDTHRTLTLRPGANRLGRDVERGRFPGGGAVPQPLPGLPPVTGAGPATSVAPRGDAAGDRPVPRSATPAARPRSEERGARRPPRQPGGDRGGARRGDPQPSTRQP